MTLLLTCLAAESALGGNARPGEALQSIFMLYQGHTMLLAYACGCLHTCRRILCKHKMSRFVSFACRVNSSHAQVYAGHDQSSWRLLRTWLKPEVFEDGLDLLCMWPGECGGVLYDNELVNIDSCDP